jgi:uncharacterized MAPEG superfamily protein
MNPALAWPALATLGTLLLLFACAAIVGRARGRYGIRAPATSGHEMFDRAFRVQMNTLESALIFLPALWLAALSFSPLWATVAAAVWLLGRVWFAAAYLRAPESRGGGFVLAFAAWGALMLMASWGVIGLLLAR